MQCGAMLCFMHERARWLPHTAAASSSSWQQLGNAPVCSSVCLQIAAHDGTLAAMRRQLEAAQAEQERCLQQVQSGLATAGGPPSQVPEASQGEQGSSTWLGRELGEGLEHSACRPGDERASKQAA